jgi:hypothetical protein
MENTKLGDMELIDGLTVYPTLEEAEEWGAVEDEASFIEDESELVDSGEAQ